MSKLSRKRKRLPGPMTSTQAESIPSISNSMRPSPIDRNEEFFRRQLEAAINESKQNTDFSENSVYCICHGEETPGMIGCDYCDEWYHPHCLNLNKNDVKRLSNENWSCPKCAKKKGKSCSSIPDRNALKEHRNESNSKLRGNYAISDDEQDDISSTESFEEESDSDEEYIVPSRKQNKNKAKLKSTPTSKHKNVKTKANKNSIEKKFLHSSESNIKSNPFIDDDNAHIKDSLPLNSSEDVTIKNKLISAKLPKANLVGQNTKVTENSDKHSDSENEFIEEVASNTPKNVKLVSSGTNLMKNSLHSKPTEFNKKSTISTNVKNESAQNSTDDFKKSDNLKNVKLVKTGFVGGNTKSTEILKKQSDRENENITHFASNTPKAARSAPSRTNLVKNPLHSKPIESNKKSLVSTNVKDELAQNSSESIKKSSLPSNSSVLRSLSVPRKWKPPTMITGNTKCMNSRNSQTSPSAISKNTIEQLTPRLRVGLTRNFKSPKPLHASLKWTP